MRSCLYRSHPRVSALAVAPNGSWLASASGDVDTGGEVLSGTTATPHVPTDHTCEVRALAVAPDGSWLASATDNIDTGDDIRIWDTATGACRHTLTGHIPRARIRRTGWVSALAVAPDGSWLASASGDIFKGGEVRIWDSATGACRHTLTGHTDSVSALAVAPDGSWLVSASGDVFAEVEVRIWDCATGASVTPSPLTPAVHLRWQSHRTGPGWPRPVMMSPLTQRCESGIPLPEHAVTSSPARHLVPEFAVPAGYRPWRSHRMDPGSPQPAAMPTPAGKCGSGTLLRALFATSLPATPARYGH